MSGQSSNLAMAFLWPRCCAPTSSLLVHAPPFPTVQTQSKGIVGLGCFLKSRSHPDRAFGVVFLFVVILLITVHLHLRRIRHVGF